MSNSNSAMDPATKEKVKLRFSRIYKILVEGCGREHCFCKLCKNNPESQEVNANAAASIAIKNTQNDLPLCEDRIIPQSLQAMEIDLLTNELSDSASYLSLLYKRVTEVFGSYESLNMSFLTNSDFKIVFTAKSPRIDFGSLKNFFDLITKIDSNQVPPENSVKAVLNKSIKNVLDTFHTETKENRIVEIGQLRFLLILLEIPQIFDYDFNAALFGIIKISLNLPPTLKQGLISWFSTYEKERFARIVENFQNTISIQIITFNGDLNYVKNLIQFTKILFEANKIANIIPVEDFYVETISQEEDPREEYARWLDNKSQNQNEFSYVDYPWILECAFKARILEEESRFEMDKEVKNDMRRILAQGQGGLFPSLETIMAFQNIILKFEVRREQLLEDTLKKMQKTNVNFKKPFKVKFVGEQGVDEGGVKKEFFLLITRQLFVSDYGMFESREDDRVLWFNMNSIEPPVTFELAGMILGLAIYNSINLDLKFPVVLYRKLLDEPVQLRDLKDLDADLYKSLKHILEYEGDLETNLFMQFTVSYDYYGEQKIYELKEGGANINVTQKNKEEYVKLYLDWYFNKSIETQFRPFYRGFQKVVSGDAIRLFTGEELQTLICGSQHLDFAELEKAATYENGYTKDSPTIKFFWEVVHSLTPEQQRNFLQFCTGSDRAPIKGLGSMVFIIAKHGPDSDRLPSAHTCFNHVLLPEYTTKEKLQEKLLKAINNAEGFGLF